LSGIASSSERSSEPEGTLNLAILATLRAVLKHVLTAGKTSDAGSVLDIALRP
jgi:hypothetical protein